MKKIFFVISLLFFSWIWIIISDGLFDDKIFWDKIYWVVYGNKVELNGKPSNRLKVRLDSGLELYNQEKIQKIIVSGGVWIEWFDEAEIMKKYLINYWMKKEDIIVDSAWYTTRETSKNSFQILSNLEDDMSNITIVWISQYFHISRVKLSLKQNGFKNVYWIAPKYFELRDIYSIFREIPAYIKYKIL